METQFRKYLQALGLKTEDIDLTLSMAKEFEQYLEMNGNSIESSGLDTLKEYISTLMKEGRNSFANLISVARYCKFAKRNDFFIYFTSILNARNVLPDIGERLEAIAGKDTRLKAFQEFNLPPLGSPPEDYPRLTQMVVDRLNSELPGETCREVLTWNYHKLPAAAFKEKKDRFEKAASIDEYLEEEHKRLVKELSEFARKGEIWFEQEITPEVVEFVKGNQEICTGIRRGERIFLTKIPYAPKQYLKETNDTMKRFYACHCPLVRTAIRDGEPEIPSVFCYCSGGYAKFRWDVIFNEPVNVELLESVLKGDMRCRFAITIPKDKMK